jgi:transposase-like protein
MTITEDKAEAACLYLRDSATPYATARAHALYCDANLRRVKSLQMIGKDGSLGDREAAAYASDEYLRAMKELEGATYEMERLKALREASIFAIELFRSTNSARKAGVNL